MAQPTAAGLHESVLLMKHTPSDIGRVTNALFSADNRTLESLPRQAYQHYFDELGISLLNWIGRGQSESIDETLHSLSHTVFSHPEMKQLPDLTIKQRIGLQLRVMCAQMTLYLKVQTSASYSALLTGPRNEMSRAIVQFLYESFSRFGGFGAPSFDAGEIRRHLLDTIDNQKGIARQNVHHNLSKLVDRGLLIEERSGKSVRYRLSDRGILEARFHFEKDDTQTSEPDPMVAGAVHATEGVTQPQFEVAHAL